MGGEQVEICWDFWKIPCHPWAASPTPSSHTLPAQGPPCWSSDKPGSVPLGVFAADGVSSGTLLLAHPSPYPFLTTLAGQSLTPSHLTYYLSSSLPMVGCFVAPTHGR